MSAAPLAVAPPGPLRAALLIARHSLRESLRRRVFLVVGLLTVAFLALYGLGVWQAVDASRNFQGVAEAGVEAEVVAGATLTGLAMFAILFLGTVLAVFLTLGAVRGEAESGLLQPLIVRPVGRPVLLLGRWLAAATVCALYVVVVCLVAFAITWIVGDWWPDRTLTPLLSLAAAVAILAALSLAGSVVLAATANGIAVFMLFGAGLTAGLLGQIADAIDSRTLADVAHYATWALPFEGLYQSGLSDLTANTVGFTRLAIQLGPFGGAQSSGIGLWLWSAAYLAVVGGLAALGFRRRDL